MVFQPMLAFDPFILPVNGERTRFSPSSRKRLPQIPRAVTPCAATGNEIDQVILGRRPPIVQLGLNPKKDKTNDGLPPFTNSADENTFRDKKHNPTKNLADI